MKTVLLLVCLLAFTVGKQVPINSFIRLSGSERFSNVIKAVQHAKIVGGVESEPHAHPYLVGLFITYENGTAFCSGSLISREYVLTAAQCIDDGKNKVIMWTAVLGAHNIYDEENSVRIQSTIGFTFSGWIPSILGSDLGLILLSTKAPLNENIVTVKLPPYSATGISFVGAKSTLVGWGKPADNANESLSEVVREIEVPVLSNGDCNSKYLGSIYNYHICTNGSNGKGACVGDSGSPLITIFEGRKIQIGIASFGLPFGCESGWPTVYTRVSEFIDWITLVAGINP